MLANRYAISLDPTRLMDPASGFTDSDIGAVQAPGQAVIVCLAMSLARVLIQQDKVWTLA